MRLFGLGHQKHVQKESNVDANCTHGIGCWRASRSRLPGFLQGEKAATSQSNRTYLHLIHRLRRRDIALGTVTRHRLAGTGTLRARLIRSAASLKVSQKRKFRGGVVSAFNPQIRRSKGKRSVGFSFVHAFAYFKLDHVVGQRSTSIAPCR